MMFEIVFCTLLTIYIQMLAQTVGTASGDWGGTAIVRMDEGGRGMQMSAEGCRECTM